MSSTPPGDAPPRERTPAEARNGAAGGPRPRGAARTFSLAAVSVLLGLLLALGLAEVGLRVAGIAAPRLVTKRFLTNLGAEPRVSYACYPSNPHGEFSPAPDVSTGSWRLLNPLMPPEEEPLGVLRATPWCVEYRVLADGLRDREYPAGPGPGVVRLIAMGDSFVFGEGVRLEDTLSRQLERALGPGVEVVNAGWPGIGTAVELERLRQVAPRLRASRALVVFTANDIDLTPELEARQTYINDLINIRDKYLERHEDGEWYAASRLLRLAGRALALRSAGRDTLRWYADMYDPAYNAANLGRFRGYLQAFAALEGTRVALVLFPMMEGLEAGYPLQGVHDRVATMAREAGLPVLDLAPAFRGQVTRELWVHDTDHHPNSRAQRIAAAAIAHWLRAEQAGFLAPDVPGQPP